jgi:hypothetical protein
MKNTLDIVILTRELRHSGQPGEHDLMFCFPEFKYWNEYAYG